MSAAVAPTMLATHITGPERAELVEVDLPVPGPGEIRVRLEGSGVCGSDLPVWQGRPWFEYPREPGAPGHEGWGHVDAVGDGVTGLREGDRVTGLLFHAYAEQDLMQAADAVRLPGELDGLDVPGEPLACAMNVMARSGIEAGMTVAILGTGFLGLLLTQLAAAAGAQVIAVGRREVPLTLARQMGAGLALDMGEDPLTRIGSASDGRLCDVVVEATGAPETLELAGPLTRVRGRIVIAGYHQDGRRSIDVGLWNWRGLDVINAHERDPAIYRAGLAAAVAAIGEGRLDPRPLFSHRVGLSDPAQALGLASRRPVEFVKALMVNDVSGR